MYRIDEHPAAQHSVYWTLETAARKDSVRHFSGFEFSSPEQLQSMPAHSRAMHTVRWLVMNLHTKLESRRKIGSWTK